MTTTTYLTSPEVAASAKVSLRTVHRDVALGRLPVHQKLNGPNGAFLFTQDVVEQYVASRKANAA